MAKPAKIPRVEVGVPPRPMLYSLDQIATITAMDLDHIRTNRVHYEGRSAGIRPRKSLLARDIGEDGSPDWRVAEQEFFRWLKACGFRIHERGWIRD